MANIVTYPLNGIEYQASDAETHYSTRISGVYTTEDYKCSVTGANTTVTVSEGIAWIRNKRFAGKSACMPVATNVDLGVANASLPRWDVVCLQFDANENETDIVVKNGTAASSPVLPAISQTETLYELYLCKVYRPAGSATISAGDVYDLRLDPELCGLMADSVTEIDTSAINAQINSLTENLREEIAGVEDESALMLKSVYDTDGDGTVDNAKKLDGHEADYFMPKSESNALIGGTDIPANSDLNSYTQPGNYCCYANAAAATLVNCPASSAFILRVFASSVTGTWQHRWQELMPIQGSQNYSYLRRCGSNDGGITWNWDEWQTPMPKSGGTFTGLIQISRGDKGHIVLDCWGDNQVALTSYDAVNDKATHLTMNGGSIGFFDENEWSTVVTSKGCTFTGEVYSNNLTHHPAGGYFRNIEVWQGGQQVSTGLIHMERK